MVTKNSWIRFPHTFVVRKPTNPDAIPPDPSKTDILSGNCGVQVPSGGGEKNESEAMVYDYMLFHKELLTEEIKANYEIECVVNGQTVKGTVMKSFPGQLTNRIWFNEISN